MDKIISIIEFAKNYLNIIYGFVALIAGLCAYFTGFYKKCTDLAKNLFLYLHKKATNPLSVLQINSQFPDLNTTWYMGKHGEDDAMQVMGSLLVTNNTESNMELTGALLSSNIRGEVHVLEDKSNRVSENNIIYPKKTARISVNFWVQKPFRKKGEDLITKVGIIDQRGQTHWSNEIKFKNI